MGQAAPDNVEVIPSRKTTPHKHQRRDPNESLYSLLSTLYSLLSTLYSLLPTPYSLLSLLPAARCLLPHMNGGVHELTITAACLPTLRNRCGIMLSK